MKVLSLTEPFATLIKEEKKLVETRSWKLPINNMKENNYQEYICGEYSVGRYAWILENVELLDKPILAKGHLGVWNYE